jgi:integrase
MLVGTGARFSADTGIRPSELCAARLSHLDLANCTLKLDNCDAKPGSGGTVGFGDETARWLQEYLTWQAQRKLASEDDHLFVNMKGHPLKYRHWHRLLNKYAAKADLPRVSPHQFRVHCATRHFQMGTDEETIQHALRHKDPTMTRHYRRVASKEQAAEQMRLSSVIDALASRRRDAGETAD